MNDQTRFFFQLRSWPGTPEMDSPTLPEGQGWPGSKWGNCQWRAGGLVVALLALTLGSATPLAVTKADTDLNPDKKDSNSREQNGPFLGGMEFSGEVIVAPHLTATVTAPLWGKIYLEKGIYPGAWVKEEQPLAHVVLELTAEERRLINDRTIDIEQALQVAKDKARRALGDYRRAVEISKGNPDFEAEVERRKKIYNNALKELEITNQQNRRQESVLKSRDPRTLVVKAPLSGYIGEIQFTPGEINPIDQFRTLMSIVNLSTVWVRAEISEKDLWVFKDSPSALITTSAYPDEMFQGRFQALGSAVDPLTRTVPVYYQVRNPDQKLKLGVRVRLRPSQE